MSVAVGGRRKWMWAWEPVPQGTVRYCIGTVAPLVAGRQQVSPSGFCLVDTHELHGQKFSTPPCHKENTWIGAIRGMQVGQTGSRTDRTTGVKIR